MRTRTLAILGILGALGFTGVFVSADLRSPISGAATAASDRPAASVSELTSEGRFELNVYTRRDLDVRLDIRFTPYSSASVTGDTPPDVNFATLDQHMHSFDPPLERVGPGEWRARLVLPVAGRWVASAGYGEDWAEVEFDAR